MTRPWVKVCGLRTVEAIEAAVAAGADAVGFVFHEPSPRHLEPAAARALAAAVPPHVEKVAVFLRPTQSLLDAAIEAVQPRWAQLDIGALGDLRVPDGVGLLPVVRSREEATTLRGARFLFEGARSGAGERADWLLAAELAHTGELVLAGGLDASNVAAAIEAARPFGVDVSSGVERERGVKDVARIHEFVSAARAAGARLTASPLEH